MNAVLMTPDDAFSVIWTRLKSNDYWLIVAASPQSQELMTAIEEKFYRGESSADFDLLIAICPGFGMMGIATGHKRRMTREQLSEFAGITVGEKQDVLLSPDTPISALAWVINQLEPRSRKGD